MSPVQRTACVCEVGYAVEELNAVPALPENGTGNGEE
jgi:hypothetical protein